VSYEDLMEGEQPVGRFSICTICLGIAPTPLPGGTPWRCAECGSGEGGGTRQTLQQYLEDNTPSMLEQNLRQWLSIKGMRPAFKMRKSARYKCLLTLSRKRHGE
jgi:hypothetical protein